MTEKNIVLRKDIKKADGTVIAVMVAYLTGDGSTPSIQTSGAPNYHSVIGYKDDGTPIINHEDDILIENAQQNFMAEAIKEQKKLCVENGVDPDLVNILNAEKKVDTNDEQSTN